MRAALDLPFDFAKALQIFISRLAGKPHKETGMEMIMSMISEDGCAISVRFQEIEFRPNLRSSFFGLSLSKSKLTGRFINKLLQNTVFPKYVAL